MDPLFYLPIVYVGVVIGSKLLGVRCTNWAGVNNRHRGLSKTLTGWGHGQRRHPAMRQAVYAVGPSPPVWRAMIFGFMVSA